MTDWPHAPVHRFHPDGLYMVTAGTYAKEKHFSSDGRLELLHSGLLEYAEEFGWKLHAWAVFPNHYHFVGYADDRAKLLRKFLGKLHMQTARVINEDDKTPGRKVWNQYWDTELTYERSYMARLAYVHENAVHHGIVEIASHYRWCSAGWFEQNASQAFVKSVRGMKTDSVNVPDDF